TQFGNRFFDEAQVQAAAGYVVIMANPRGSAGREEAWARAIVGPKAAHDPGRGWGSVDYDDVMATMDETLRRYPAIDPARLSVLGAGGQRPDPRGVRRRHRHWLPLHLRRRVVRGPGGVPADVAHHVRARHRDATADPPLRGRSALSHRRRRAALRGAAPPGPG